MSYYVFFPTRNGEATLIQTIKALLKQSLFPSKILIVNDGSQDTTADILRKYACEYPNLFKIWNTKDAGTDFSKIPYFYNFMTRHVQGKFDYGLALADDIKLPVNYVMTLVKTMEKNPNVVVSSGVRMKWSRSPSGAGRVIQERFFQEIGGKYPFQVGFESWILEEAKARGYRLYVNRSLWFEHLQPSGRSHGFRNYGQAMYYLNYFPLYVLCRSIHAFFNEQIRFKTVNMLAEYLKLSISGVPRIKDGQAGNYTRLNQKHEIVRLVKRFVVNPKKCGYAIKRGTYH